MAGVRSLICLTSLLLATPSVSSASQESDAFEIRGSTIISICSPKGELQFLAPGKHLGDIEGRARTEGEKWQAFSSERPGIVAVSSQFRKRGDGVEWTIKLENPGDSPVEIGDLAISLPMNGRFDEPGDIQKSVLKHSFVSGAGSFLFWSPRDAKHPRLCLTTGPKTSLEYWSAADPAAYRVFLCSSASQADAARDKGTKWRVPATRIRLAPHEVASRTLFLDWSATDQGVRDLLVRRGRPDVQIVPGMTVPRDLSATIAVRGIRAPVRWQSEHPNETSIRGLGLRNGYQQFQISFRRLGENRLTLLDSDGGKTYLEFFCTEPIETLIRKRAAFLAKCQHTDPTKWYRGLISDWNMETETLLGPDNYDRITGWRIYAVTCDDPGLGKPSFLAAKNAEMPVQSEVTALDDYIQHFVWGGLQQTPQEPYPYGIYGIPDWKTLRERTTGKPTDGVAHLWRCYDYPHIILLYHSMFRISQDHPEVRTRLSARTYLERAYGTALAFFTLPNQLVQWSPYGTGYYNELILPALIHDLRANGMVAEANILRGHWEKKVKHFVLENPDLFGSEYAFDSTGFESTHALADYAARNSKSLGISTSQWRRFMVAQTEANLFCRGTVEPAYYTLGSDYRGGAGNAYTLSYMSAMGGGSLLDYGLNYAGTESPFFLRLGTASLLSSWALMNTGTPESNYGYWYPGKGNDGGAGGGFEPAAYGQT